MITTCAVVGNKLAFYYEKHPMSAEMFVFCSPALLLQPLKGLLLAFSTIVM